MQCSTVHADLLGAIMGISKDAVCNPLWIVIANNTWMPANNALLQRGDDGQVFFIN
jgi:hypothetical protein